MRFCRFAPLTPSSAHPNSPLYGVLEGAQVREISGAPWFTWSPGAHAWPSADVRLLAPVEPGKIVCVGRNYAAHAAELGNELPKEPLIFLKPPSAILGPGEAVRIPPQSQRVEHEGELALVVGRTCSRLDDAEDSLAYLLGYTCLNDVTARDIQKNEVQFTRAKGFDTFCPIGPHIETQLDPANALVETRVNGALRQSGRTSLMIYPVAFLVRWISHVMTLYPGDVIATGTPAGVGPLLPGDSVEVSVGGVGVLRNPVQA
ncbi:MAG TPA: fumarylacetoacetate hydrolase family protein [Candidatus Acidoferrum sp.]|nr:fumarylacetoacetate hydrolase family protein [Candidatus Acidoferrum sp.]